MGRTFQGFPRAVLILCGVVLAAGGFVVFSSAEDNRPEDFGIDVVRERAFWASRISEVGGMRAYDELAEEIASAREGRRYKAAHIFALALYDKEGIEGVRVCDERFGRGCLHEFMGQGVLRSGIDSAQKLLNECHEERPSENYYCAHALGHGFVAYFGYEEKNLPPALSACHVLRPAELGTSCDLGVFFEYNLQVNRYVGGVVVRPMSTGGELGACESLAGLGRKMCLYSLAQWWVATLAAVADTSEEKVRTMLSYCDSVPEAEGREICRTGVARYIPQIAGFDIEKAKVLCKETFSKEVATCQIYAASLVLVERGRDAVRAMCLGLSESERARCEDIIERPYYGSSSSSPKSR